MIPLKNITTSNHACRSGCAACCIAPSITSTTAAMPQGKPAGKVCIHLNEHLLCELFGQAERPKVCSNFSFDIEVCGTCREQALQNLDWLEVNTAC
ncbi:MAG: YkgJ family cysteine cluster protein [Pseudomonadaceae bacterium]|nr:YkgJ family cysteine cluster protein [Pseudomonadaceae bacterium]